MSPEQRSHYLTLGLASGIVIVLALGWVALFGLPGAQPKPVPNPGGTPPPGRCTFNAQVDRMPPVLAGDVVCVSGTLADRLVIQNGGTADRPITYDGGGTTTVQGIDIETSNVVVRGFNSVDGRSMGAQLLGNNIVFQNNTITHPVYAGEDTDGIRFFGDHIKMLNNRVSDVSDGSRCTKQGCSGTGGPHPDCFQTFYSPEYPTSSDILIDGNHCEKIVAQCLIAEGTNVPDEGIAGPGDSANWTFRNNYCDDNATQALMIKDIKNVSIINNDFEGTNHKAIALADGSTGAHVSGNKLNPRIPKLITFDDGNEAAGYNGPPPDPE
jgi:hypothetical protein